MGAWSGSRLRDVVAFFMTGILGLCGRFVPAVRSLDPLRSYSAFVSLLSFVVGADSRK